LLPKLVAIISSKEATAEM